MTVSLIPYQSAEHVIIGRLSPIYQRLTSLLDKRAQRDKDSFQAIGKSDVKEPKEKGRLRNLLGDRN